MAFKQMLHVLKLNSGVILAQPGVAQNNQLMSSRRHYKPKVLKAEFRKVIDPKYNKGLGYTHRERQNLNVIGLYPCACRNDEEQLYAVKSNFIAQKSNVARYLYLRSVRARQERLYYRFIIEEIESVMPIVYTPTVGDVCQAFSSISDNSLGLYVTKYDKGNMVNVLGNWPGHDVRAVCVTDGGRILGLGDLAANGMGISVGKLDLYTALGNIPPQYLVPIVLDVGTNNQQLLCDPMYIGVREERCVGEEYDELVEEFMRSVVECWGYQTLIHFEDFATDNAFRLIKKYRDKYCYFNDDIQGTASTGLAGFLNVEHITKQKLEEQVILFVGAGSAALGICNLLVRELANRKVSQEDAAKNIYFIDVDGLVTKDRKTFPVQDVVPFAKDMPKSKDLQKIVDEVIPSILLGATGQGGLFTENILRSMAKNHENPAIFACSNPTPKAECTAEQAYNFTEGRALFASGSPFPPVVVNGKRLTPTQANNAFAFPGVALGVLCSQPRIIPDEVFIVAAHAIAGYVNQSDPATRNLYPTIKEAANVNFQVGVSVAQYLIDKGLANVYPVPKDVSEFVKNYQYYTTLSAALPHTWEYPEMIHLPLPKATDDEKCDKK